MHGSQHQTGSPLAWVCGQRGLGQRLGAGQVMIKLQVGQRRTQFEIVRPLSARVLEQRVGLVALAQLVACQGYSAADCRRGCLQLVGNGKYLLPLPCRKRLLEALNHRRLRALFQAAAFVLQAAAAGARIVSPRLVWRNLVENAQALQQLRQQRQGLGGPLMPGLQFQHLLECRDRGRPVLGLQAGLAQPHGVLGAFRLQLQQLVEGTQRRHAVVAGQRRLAEQCPAFHIIGNVLQDLTTAVARAGVVPFLKAQACLALEEIYQPLGIDRHACSANFSTLCQHVSN